MLVHLSRLTFAVLRSCPVTTDFVGILQHVEKELSVKHHVPVYPLRTSIASSESAAIVLPESVARSVWYVFVRVNSSHDSRRTAPAEDTKDSS
jgi:hypothetical protein